MPALFQDNQCRKAQACCTLASSALLLHLRQQNQMGPCLLPGPCCVRCAHAGGRGAPSPGQRAGRRQPRVPQWCANQPHAAAQQAGCRGPHACGAAGGVGAAAHREHGHTAICGVQEAQQCKNGTTRGSWAGRARRSGCRPYSPSGPCPWSAHAPSWRANPIRASAPSPRPPTHLACPTSPNAWPTPLPAQPTPPAAQPIPPATRPTPSAAQLFPPAAWPTP